MKKNIRRQTKLTKFEPKLNIDEFNALTDLLFELLKEKHQACARILGISRSTWRKWETEPPTWPWWNHVLRTIIKHYIASLRTSKGLTGEHRRRVMKALHEIPNVEDFIQEIDTLATDLSGAETHLRRVLAPRGMFLDELLKAANSGGYTEKTLRRAARRLGIIRTSEGYGDHKRSFWRLPTADDD